MLVWTQKNGIYVSYTTDADMLIVNLLFRAVSPTETQEESDLGDGKVIYAITKQEMLECAVTAAGRSNK